ncbi:MAG TPA: response regulator transcription factor [Myxococcales bacterium]|jgi:two-component system, OmpR family, phosphate regulon response regulator PhoB|nr:response regulator transcription factor [Myxococcales bacterium]
MPRVLVVDDEKDLRGLLEYNLTQAGFTVTTAQDGREALAKIKAAAPDLVILDLLLPDIPGTEVLKQVKRERPDLPVLMLTAKGEEVDRLVGLELGADDYVVKPFSVRELVLRVRAILRRADATEAEAPRYEFRDLTVDVERHVVSVSGKPVDLTALEFRLLTTLLQRKGRVQTRQALLTDVWGLSGDLATRTVDTHIKRLREKLGAASEYVETVRGIGYRFAED